MDDAQLMKGILEGCVLAVIARGETYGYDILLQLEAYGFDNVLEGTLYPILTRLDKKGLLERRMVRSPLGPMRKNYRITKAGTDALAAFKKRYLFITSRADAILFADRIRDRKDGQDDG